MRDAKEVERLVREGLPIVEGVARRMQRKLGGAIHRDELVAIAQPALLEAAREHDSERAPFAPYVVLKVKWAMLDEARKGKRRRTAARAAGCAALELLADDAEREPPARTALGTEEDDQNELVNFLAQRAAALALGLISVPETDRHGDVAESPEERLAREELRRDLRSAVQKLPDKQRALVERHYFEGEHFDAIAADLGFSKSWASRLHAQAMVALAESLRVHAR